MDLCSAGSDMRSKSLITATDKGFFFCCAAQRSFTQPPASGKEGFRGEMLVTLLALLCRTAVSGLHVVYHPVGWLIFSETNKRAHFRSRYFAGSLET